MPTENANAIEILNNLESEVDNLVDELGRDLADYFDRRFGPAIQKISDLESQPRPRLQTQPVSWKDLEGEKQRKGKYAPKWKGIRGLMKWLWRGNDEDGDSQPRPPEEKKTWPKAPDLDLDKLFPGGKKEEHRYMQRQQELEPMLPYGSLQLRVVSVSETSLPLPRLQ